MALNPEKLEVEFAQNGVESTEARRVLHAFLQFLYDERANVNFNFIWRMVLSAFISFLETYVDKKY